MIQKLWTQYQSQGLRVLAISVDEKLDALTSFVKEHGLAYPVIAAAHQPGQFDQNIPDLYESRGIPAYFLIDRKGIIRRTHSGAITETKSDLPDAIEQVLAESAVRSAHR